MNKGKSTCKVLKDIRQKIADANGIHYVPKECNFEGECKGTCPTCEAEIRYLEREIKRKQRNGLAVKVGGIAAGLCAMVAPMQVEAQNTTEDCTTGAAPHRNFLDSIAVTDLSNGVKDAIVVNGCVISEEDKEPVIAAIIKIVGTDKGTVTDLDGNFAIKVPQDASLEVSFIGMNNKIIKAKDLLETKNRTIVLDSHGVVLQGEVLVGAVDNRYRDDVYNRTTPKYKSHEKKCKK